MTVNELRAMRAKAWESAKNFLDSHRNENGMLSLEDTKTYEEMEARNSADVGNDVGNTTQKKIAERYSAIKELMKSNPYITAIQLSEKLAVSDRTIERDIAKLQEDRMLNREGDRNRGRWIVIK